MERGVFLPIGPSPYAMAGIQIILPLLTKYLIIIAANAILI